MDEEWMSSWWYLTWHLSSVWECHFPCRNPSAWPSTLTKRKVKKCYQRESNPGWSLTYRQIWHTPLALRCHLRYHRSVECTHICWSTGRCRRVTRTWDILTGVRYTRVMWCQTHASCCTHLNTISRPTLDRVEILLMWLIPSMYGNIFIFQFTLFMMTLIWFKYTCDYLSSKFQRYEDNSTGLREAR